MEDVDTILSQSEIPNGWTPTRESVYLLGELVGTIMRGAFTEKQNRRIPGNRILPEDNPDDPDDPKTGFPAGNGVGGTLANAMFGKPRQGLGDAFGTAEETRLTPPKISTVRN